MAIQKRGAVAKAATVEKNQLVFNKTYTVEQFKIAIGTATIDVKENPHTNKLFMVDDAGNVIGAVASKIQSSDDLTVPVISLVVPAEFEGDESQEFPLLHNKGEGAESIFSL